MSISSTGPNVTVKPLFTAGVTTSKPPEVTSGASEQISTQKTELAQLPKDQFKRVIEELKSNPTLREMGLSLREQTSELTGVEKVLSGIGLIGDATRRLGHAKQIAIGATIALASNTAYV